MKVGIFCVNDADHEYNDPSVVLFTNPSKRRYNFGIFSALTRTMREFQPDVVHAWLPASVTIPAMLVARREGIPCVFSYRSAMAFYRPLMFLEFFVATCCAKGIISNTPVSVSKWSYRKLYSWKRSVTIPNAVAVPSDLTTPGAARGPNGVNRLVFVGRLTQQKNWACLLEALSQLRERKDWVLIICGSGEDLPRVEAKVEELRIADRVQLLGFRRDIYRIMHEATLLVLPSWVEGMPNVMLEAFALGLPCIASDIAQHREVVGDSGCALLFDPSQPDQLAAAVLRVLNGAEEAREMAVRARKVAASYLPDYLGARYYEAYRAFLTGDFTAGRGLGRHRLTSDSRSQRHNP
jgi:glycosyltransferase involved in cell wall biosynthesis